MFSTLEYLIRNRGAVVSKDDLISQVWGGRAISDATLSSRIFAARRAIGGTGKTKALIRTVPRRGFRFVGDVISEGRSQPAGRPATRAASTDAGGAVPAAIGGAPAAAYQGAVMPTMAVLPFQNMSKDLDEYLCYGVTGDIISNLTHFSELRVIASSSTFQFKGQNVPLVDMAAALNADYIVDGTVRFEGNRLRISVQLVEAVSGVSIWADMYDREMEESFAVQDTVTHMIAASLGVKLQGAALSRALRKSLFELDAYDYLLRARRYTATLNEKMHAEARDLLEKATALDHNYADAYALLSNVYLAEYRFDSNPRPDPVDRALKMALRATQLVPGNAYAHCWLAVVHFSSQRHPDVRGRGQACA